MSHRSIYFIGGHILKVDMSYTCPIGENVSLRDMSNLSEYIPGFKYKFEGIFFQFSIYFIYINVYLYTYYIFI